MSVRSHVSPVRRGEGMRGRSSWEIRQKRAFVVMLLPSLAVLGIITFGPFVYLLVTSFTPLNLTMPGSFHWAGALNYTALIQDDRFFNSLWVQARLSFWTVLFQVLVGLGLALLLNSHHRFIEILRGTFIIPMVLPPVVVAVIWKIFFTPGVSVLNWSLGLLGLPQPNWLGDATLAIWAIVITDVWEWMPFTMLIILAALQMLPTEPLEAAEIDGASRLQLFRYVVLPLLRPAIVLAALFRFIDSVKVFPEIFIMTGGGPGTATEATNYYAYLEGFSYTFIGYASAIVVVMLAVTFFLSYLTIQTIGTGVDVE